jgi:Ras GTPase-activating-like protein IQGAP2/3
MGGAHASPFAYSHLLARRGLAERIGNLVGRLQFSDDQLQKTQKGLKDAGVPMPNFGNVGRDVQEETEEESQCLTFPIVLLSPFSSS